MELLFPIGHPVREQVLSAIRSVAATAAKANRNVPGAESELALLWEYLNRSGIEWSAPEETAATADTEEEDAEPPPHAGLYGGLSGIAWITQYLLRTSPAEEGGESCGADDPRDAIDTILLELLREPVWTGSCNLSTGLAGIGTYFLERLPSANSTEAIHLVVGHLEGLAESTEWGITWHTGPAHLTPVVREQHPFGYYDPNVPHGVAGIVHFLNELSARGIGGEIPEKLLNGAVEWILAQQDPSPSLSRFFPLVSSGAVPGADPYASASAGLAWCQGDLGILTVLSRVARRREHSTWLKVAGELLDHCLLWPSDQNRFHETGLCHGATGLGHVYNRMAQFTGDSRCRDAAAEWFQFALQRLDPDAGRTRDPNASGMRMARTETQLLNGGVGVALALLATVSDVEPEWDRMMAISGGSP